MADVLRLRPVSYELIGSGEKQIGFVAQEVNEVVPEVVVPGNQETNWTMSYGNLVALAIKGIQELSAKVTALMSGQEEVNRKLSALEKENQELKARLESLEKKAQP
jgi:cell shape-determining protein MreC